MAEYTGGDITSSMTSVTEDNCSLSESDTTDTCSNSNFSSVINSTDYNTDDKLTPCLNSISISKAFHENSSLKRTSLFHGNDAYRDKNNKEKGQEASYTFAVSSSSLARQSSSRDKRKCQKKNQSETSVSKNKRWKTIDFNSSFGNEYQDRGDGHCTFTFDNPDYNLYTDFSNHINPYEEDSDEEGESHTSESGESYWPNMTSPSWYMARVFDNYWSHYNYVMDWYREHIKFVCSQSAQYFREESPKNIPQPQNKKKSNARERKRKKRKRRTAKSKLKQKSDCGENAIHDEKDVQEDEETIEMEITEDLINFFSQSHKHRLERDKIKQNEEQQDDEATRVDIEQAMSGQQGPSSETPVERPGVRRTAEMKLLFGNGAAMIHGMETALQMTFDKFTDRHQPKLWPNMPLKICFA